MVAHLNYTDTTYSESWALFLVNLVCFELADAVAWLSLYRFNAFTRLRKFCVCVAHDWQSYEYDYWPTHVS